MNARQSTISDSKTDQCIFSWKIFGGWDYTIGNIETASNAAMATVIKLRVINKFAIKFWFFLMFMFNEKFIFLKLICILGINRGISCKYQEKIQTITFLSSNIS